LYLAAIAVGRRLCLQTPWRQLIFPNLYLMVVAVSTYYRKSAGLSLAVEVARLAIPHMLMPQPGSPENFLAMLGGVLPSNLADIPPADRARLERGSRYAAQRGLLRDELSGLFKSMARDYMAGLKELIMTLYDCPPYLDSSTNHKGLIVIREAALSILGTATPAELSSALSASDWYNGNLARFALLTPEPNYAERPAPQASPAPTDLAERLKRLHERLPEPPQLRRGGTSQNDHNLSASDQAWQLTADIWPACRTYEQALRAMTSPRSPLDDRLRATYGRLHVQAIKIAVLLAALDWADDIDCAPRPHVTAAHWYRAQEIAEEWRASAHRLLADLGETEEGRLEERILRFLRACGGSATARDVYRALRASRRTVQDALKALEDDGQVVRVLHGCSGRGRPPEKYALADAVT
jgi:DNA-binding transcriptional ArsR family regulator